MNRRSWRSIFGDKNSRLNAALLGSVFVFFPSCLFSVIALYALANGVNANLEAGADMDTVSQAAYQFALYCSAALVANFFLLAFLSGYLALKIMHQIVGPVEKLENMLKRMIDGNFTEHVTLRKGDYLGGFGILLNELADKLDEKSDSK